MTISDIGSIGEAVGAIAVVVSLFYLAVQVRQNTRATRAATFKDVNDAWQGVMLELSQPESARVFSQGCLDPSKLQGADLIRFFFQTRTFFRRYEHDFHQQSTGSLEADAWQGYVVSLKRDLLRSPGIQRVWALDRETFSPGFASFVDAQIEDVNRNPGRDFVAILTELGSPTEEDP